MKRNWGWLVGVVVSALALALAVRGVPLRAVAEALAGARYEYLIPTVAALAVMFGVRAWRWRGLMSNKVRLARAFHAVTAGALLNNVLPLRLGELGRAYLISRGRQVAGMEALSTIMVERLLDMLAGVLVLAVSLPPAAPSASLRASADWIRPAGLVAGGLSAGIFALLVVAAHARTRLTARLMPFISRWLPARIAAQFDLVLDGLTPLRDGAQTASAVLSSATIWLLSGLAGWWCLLAFDPTATWQAAFFALGVAALGVAVPSAPAFVGVLEASIVAALTAYGMDKSLALAYAVVLHAINYLITIALGGLALSLEGETLLGLSNSARSFLAGLRPSRASV